MAMTECVDALADGSLLWVGGSRKAVVILGDTVDRWRAQYRGGRGPGEFKDEEHAILRACNDLAVQAQRAGSAVFRLVGNHELLQMRPGGTMYASPFAVDNDGGADSRLASFADGRYLEEVGACGVRAILKIGDHVFVHGGVNTGVVEAAGDRNFLDACNDALRDFLLADREAKASQMADVGSDVNVFLYNADRSRGGKAEDGGILWDDRLSSFGRLDCSKSATMQSIFDELSSQQLPPRHRSLAQWVRYVYTARVLAALNANLGSATPATTFVLGHCMQSVGARAADAPFSRFVSLRSGRDYEQMVPAGYATVQQFLRFFPFLHKTSIHVSFGFTVWDNEIIVYIAEPALFGLGHGKASNTRWISGPTPHCVTGSFWTWTWKGIEHKAGFEPDSTFRNRLFLDVDRRNRQTSMVW